MQIVDQLQKKKKKKKAQRGSEREALSPPSAATLDEADLRPLWPN